MYFGLSAHKTPRQKVGAFVIGITSDAWFTNNSCPQGNF